MKDREGEPPGEPSPWQSPYPWKLGGASPSGSWPVVLCCTATLGLGDYCAEKNITPDVESIPIQQVNED